MSFELNKIAGAILGTLLLVMGLGFLAEAIYAPIEGRGPGYTLPEPEEGGEQTEVAEVEATPLPVLLASASAEQGAQDVRKCQSCHTFEEGGGNKTGPGLYDVVGRPIASHEGFAYSDALIAYGEEHGDWTYETLAAFIHDPRGEVPGTKMTFAGVSDEEELADVLAYLQTLSADPVPFPEPAAEEEAAEEPAADAEVATADEDTVEAEEPVDVAEEAVSEQPADEDPTDEVVGAEQPADEEPVVEDEEPAEDSAADEAATEEPAVEAEEPAADEPADEDVSAAEEAPSGEASELELAIANASLEDGEAAMRKCRTCHDWTEDGRNKVGPVLYDVVGRPIAGYDGYPYSDAMIAYGEEHGDWSYELLDAFLADPRGDIPGTKMTFAGIRDEEERAAIIAFLRAQSAEPAPLAGAE